MSTHIRILERAGLVRRRRAGREHYLSFTPAPLDDAAAWIETHRSLWTARLQALDAMLHRAARNGCTVTISHELAPADIDSKDGVTKGWTDILAGLDRVMAERS